MGRFLDKRGAKSCYAIEGSRSIRGFVRVESEQPGPLTTLVAPRHSGLRAKCALPCHQGTYAEHSCYPHGIVESGATGVLSNAFPPGRNIPLVYQVTLHQTTNMYTTSLASCNPFQHSCQRDISWTLRKSPHRLGSIVHAVRRRQSGPSYCKFTQLNYCLDGQRHSHIRILSFHL